MQADAARGRQPCSGSKDGITHCTSDGRFVCNDGSLSHSKRFCSGYGASELPRQVKPSPSARQAQTKKKTAVKGQEQRVVEKKQCAVRYTTAATYMRPSLYGQQARIHPFTRLFRKSVLIRQCKRSLSVIRTDKTLAGGNPPERAGRPVTASGIKACRSHLPATWRTYCMAGVYVFCMIDKREGKL